MDSSRHIFPNARTLLACRFYGSLAVDADHAVGVGFGEDAQFFNIWLYELRPALAEDTEYLRDFHPYAVVTIIQQLGEERKAIVVGVGRVGGDVLCITPLRSLITSFKALLF